MAVVVCAFLPRYVADCSPWQATENHASVTGQEEQGKPNQIIFAVIGDFGDGGANEAAVANLVKNTLKPDFIITVGDNNYNALSVAEYDAVIGRFYSDFIGNYSGAHGPGSPANRFWPALGNHDWNETVGYQPYLDYFTLPGNERYYDFVRGPAHFFVINSDPHEPDGRSRTSTQAQWLQASLAKSTATWKFVVFHHAAFSSSSNHGSEPIMQWPFKQWGAHAVFAGHDHTYERCDVGGIPYFVCGNGGKSLYDLGAPLPQTQYRFNADYGAMLVTVDDLHATFETYSIANGGTHLDAHTMIAGSVVPDLVPPAAAWKYLDNGSNQGTGWRMPGFDDSAWSTGSAHLGYGDDDETTTVQFGPNASSKYITTYFRRSFDVTNPDTIQALRLAVLRDDGVVVYINGTEVFRSNMPVGAITYQTLASSAVADEKEDIFYEAPIDSCILVAGTNLIAVELHQSSGSSSDISFDLMLTPTIGARMCRTDIAPPPDGDGHVNVSDLLAVIETWGPCAPAPAACAADIAPACGDHSVNVNDLLGIVNTWGACR